MEKLVFDGRVRPAAAADLDVIAQMVSQLAQHHGDVATVTRDELARDILGPQPWVRVLLAEERGDVVGYAALYPMAKMQFGARGMEMHHLYVAPEARHKGVGKALTLASETLAHALGCRFLTVGTHPRNTVAQGIYRTLGFDPLDPPGPRFQVTIDA
ncbi:GNAT family N-acetyltransferase [Roseobacter sp.]|uniref:GNAT family N-acetyltransferase n=1 Tax=Roseobacter sp. TaxID=1907202 RepID=UPI003299CD19